LSQVIKEGLAEGEDGLVDGGLEREGIKEGEVKRDQHLGMGERENYQK
jgi:hypothetical protein